MQNQKNSKIIIGGVAIIILLLILWFGFWRQSSTPETEAIDSLTVGADLLKMLDDLSSATLDRSIFSDPEYLYLTDFSVPVPPQPLGRNNPFAIFGQ